MSSVIKANKAAPVQIIKAIRDRSGYSSNLGGLQGIYIGGTPSINGTGTFGRLLACGIAESTTTGNPTPPSLKLTQPCYWRFRWSVKGGQRSISVLSLQVTNTNQRPSMVVKSNASIGIASDITAVAPSGTGWVTIGPINFTVNAAGIVWVELHNNNTYSYDPAYFDHIVAS